MLERIRQANYQVIVVQVKYNTTKKNSLFKPDTGYMIHALVYLLCASVTVTLLKSLGK